MEALNSYILAKRENWQVFATLVSIKTARIFLYCICEVKMKSLSHVRLCDHMDCGLPGFSIRGIFQARILEWVVISFSRGPSQPRDWTRISRISGRCFTVWATWALRFDRKQQNSVKQLSFNRKINKQQQQQKTESRSWKSFPDLKFNTRSDS